MGRLIDGDFVVRSRDYIGIRGNWCNGYWRDGGYQLCFLYRGSDKEKSMRADESPIKVKRVNLGELGFDQNTCFATSSAYAEQFFYTKESKVFLFNTVSKESIELYDAGDVITKLKFRSDVDVLSRIILPRIVVWELL